MDFFVKKFLGLSLILPAHAGKNQPKSNVDFAQNVVLSEHIQGFDAIVLDILN